MAWDTITRVIEQAQAPLDGLAVTAVFDSEKSTLTFGNSWNGQLEIINFKEQQVKDALVKQGWAPPPALNTRSEYASYDVVMLTPPIVDAIRTMPRKDALRVIRNALMQIKNTCNRNLLRDRKTA